MTSSLGTRASFSLASIALVAALAAAQAPPPAPAPAPVDGAKSEAPATPEEADWKACLDVKASANVLNQPDKGLEAAKGFVAFREKYPSSVHATDAIVEAGVCWMIAGRSLQKWHRNTPEGAEHFKTAATWFRKVVSEHEKDPAVPRAWYCLGLVAIQLEDLAGAEQCFTKVVDAFASDRTYFGKSLERRAAVRRHLLDTSSAIADLARYQKEFAADNADVAKQSEEYKAVSRFATYAKVFDKPAPALKPETWVGTEPTSLDKAKGDVVALYFFAQWCHNCLAEAEFIREMSERWGPLGVRFIGVTDFSAAPQGSPAGPNPKDPAETQKAVETVRAYLAQHGFAFPVMMDRGTTAQLYMARKYPEMVLLDREGRIRWHDHPASLTDRTLETLLYGAPEAPKESKPAK